MVGSLVLAVLLQFVGMHRVEQVAEMVGPRRLIWTYGDSKARDIYHPAALKTLLDPLARQNADYYVQSLPNPGLTTTQIRAQVGADAAALVSPNPPLFVLLSLGSNNIDATQATLEEDIGAIADALRVQWPQVRVGITIPWIRDHDVGSNTAALAVAAVVAARSDWCFVGPDERVDLKGSDNGATNTADGVHASAAGSTVLAASWYAILHVWLGY